MKPNPRFFSLLLGVSMLALGAVQAAPERPGGLPEGVSPGQLKVLTLDGDKPDRTLELPLKHTEVKIRVQGFVARATVVQQFTNPFETPIEAVYVFPLPDRAAVDGMSMRIGERVIRAEIKKRDEARRIYEQAKADGKRAGLLEQERPNIFTQSVGNILPGDEIEVEITYVDILAFRDAGDFELVFPMVVGPRYIPGNPSGGSGGGGWAPDTGQVPDASRISPPVLKPGERSGHDIALSVELDAAVPLRGLHSVSHAVDIEELSPSRRNVRLHASERIPNKDFILRYQVAGEAPQAVVIAEHNAEGGGYFTLIALPPRQVTDEAVVPRDLIFVLDTSGSMRGKPLDQSKRAMQRLLDGMRPADRFNLVRFAGDTGTLWPEPRPNIPANLAAAKAFVESLRGAGGTEMRSGIREALAQPSDPERLRIAFLLTDGYVGNEQAILQSIEQEARGARVFTLGVGSSVNRYLLDRAAAVGRGEAFYLRQDENSEPVIQRFFKRVDRPSLAHIQVDWNGLPVSDLSPARIPDLWQGQPVKLHGRYNSGGEAPIRISGRLGSRSHAWSVPVKLPENAPGSGLMAAVWARSRVAELMLPGSRAEAREKVERQVTELGLNYRILTQWTSFVAVEEKVVNQGGESRTIVQPVELPEGVDYEGVFGAEAGLAPAMAAPMSRMLMKQALPAAPVREQSVGGAFSSPATAADALEEKAAEPQAMPAGCRYEALWVSGGLRYPQVESVLRKSWSGLCGKLGNAVRQSGKFTLVLELSGDGLVMRVRVGNGPRALVQKLRQAFKSLTFGSVTGGGPAKVGLDLILGGS